MTSFGNFVKIQAEFCIYHNANLQMHTIYDENFLKSLPKLGSIF
jgi:hypothetical protein